MIIWSIVIAVVALFGFVVFFGAPYVPTKKSDLKRAFDELYPLGPDDLLVDIGSGDGVVLRQAAKRGARAVGYEINPLLVVISKFLSRPDSGVQVHLTSFWKADLPIDTTVVYTFGDSRDIAKMTKKVQATANKNGRSIAFISYGFKAPGLKAKKKIGAHFLYEITPLQID